MACQIEKVQAILGKLEKHIDISELKAQVDKKIIEKQSVNKVVTEEPALNTIENQLSTKDKLKLILDIYNSSDSVKTGGYVENVQIKDGYKVSGSDEGIKAGEFVKGYQEENLKDYLPKISKPTLNQYNKAFNAYYNEMNRTSKLVRSKIDELLKLLGSIEAEESVATVLGLKQAQANTKEVEYQKESKYPTYNLYNSMSTNENIDKVREFNTLMKIQKSIESNLASMYPGVKVNYLKDITDNSGIRVLGRALGKVIDVNLSKLGIDTVPHEYAHVYINVLSGTPTISNVVDTIKRRRSVATEEAKEILARKIGELYVDDEIKLSAKDISIIEKVWKFIVETFKKILGGDKYKKELEEINGMQIVYKEFKTGKFKKEFADQLESYDFALAMKSSTDKRDKEQLETSESIAHEEVVFLQSPELSKYGTLDDYKKYVKGIFPESKIDYIVAHDTGSNGSMYSSGRDSVNLPFTDSWMYTDDVVITGKGEDFGLVSGEGFYTYKPNKMKEKWNQYAAFTGYMKLDIRNPLYSSSKEYKELPGDTYYAKMAALTNTKPQSNPDEWYMLDNPPEKVTVNSIVNEKTGYDGFINQVRPGLFENVAWKAEQVHILGSRKDVAGFKKYASDNGLISGGLSLSENNTVLLPVSKPKIVDDLQGEIDGFKVKEEFHITLVGFPQGKYLAKELEKMEYSEFKRHDINRALASIDTGYSLKDKFYQVERDREVFVDYRNPELGKTTVHEETLIQLVDAPGLIEGVKKINKDFGINLPIPFPHITIATKGGLGIGIASKEEFDRLNTAEVGLEGYTEEVNTKEDIITETALDAIPDEGC